MRPISLSYFGARRLTAPEDRIDGSPAVPVGENSIGERFPSPAVAHRLNPPAWSPQAMTPYVAIALFDGRSYDIGFACRVALAVFLIMLSWSLLDEYVRQRWPIPTQLRRTAQEFIDTFARPLLSQQPSGPAIRSRMRYLPEREELEILNRAQSGTQLPQSLRSPAQRRI